MPTESRSSPSLMPAEARCSAVIDECVIDAGCATSDSTPPNDSASVKHRSPSRKTGTLDSPPTSSKLTMAPKPRCCRAATAWPG